MMTGHDIGRKLGFLLIVTITVQQFIACFLGFTITASYIYQVNISIIAESMSGGPPYGNNSLGPGGQPMMGGGMNPMGMGPMGMGGPMNQMGMGGMGYQGQGPPMGSMGPSSHMMGPGGGMGMGAGGMGGGPMGGPGQYMGGGPMVMGPGMGPMGGGGPRMMNSGPMGPSPGMLGSGMGGGGMTGSPAGMTGSPGGAGAGGGSMLVASMEQGAGGQEQQQQQQQGASTAPQQQQQSKDVNTSTVCRIGQETVEEIVSRTQEVFSILKTLQPPVGSFNQQTQTHDKSNQEKQNRLQDVLKGIGMLFKRLRVCWEKCQENTGGMDFMPIESLIPLKEEGEGGVEREKKRGEAYKVALEEHNELMNQITLKNRHLKDVIDQMRNIIWEINTMLAIRRPEH